jgi:hypothetical protein
LLFPGRAKNMSIDKPMIINWALTKLGVGAVFSEDDGSDLSLAIENTWQVVVDEVFTLHDWSWSRKTVKLAAISGTPVNGWSRGFALPGDRVGPPKAFLRQAGCNPIACRNYAIEGKTVFANETDLWGTFRREIDPDDWDVGFRAAFVIALAGALAIPVWQDSKLKQDFEIQAFGEPHEKRSGGLFGHLKALDMSGEPLASPLLASDPLSDARVSGPDPYFSWAGRYG